MDFKQELIKSIESLSGSRSKYSVFNDFVTLSAIAISNGCSMFRNSVFIERESEYESIAKKYSQEEMLRMSDMLGLLALTLEAGFDDVLGSVYMQGGMGNGATGQFFTPYHLSYLCARLSYERTAPDESGNYILNEPACGGGGLIIGFAQTLFENGIDYQKRLKVVAQDLDWLPVRMCYVQLSLLGVDGMCVQGDSLAEPLNKELADHRRVYITPRKAGMLYG